MVRATLIYIYIILIEQDSQRFLSIFRVYFYGRKLRRDLI